MLLRNLSKVLLVSGLATASYAGVITNGTFNIAGEIYVTGAGGVTTPAGVCPAGIQCIFWQDTSSPAINNKVDISAGGLPSGDIPAAIAGNDAANIQNLNNPPEIVGSPGFAPLLFLSFNNGGVTTQLLINRIAAGIDGAAGCSSSPPAGGQVCTPPGSLFNLQNLSATSSTVGWGLSGITNDNPIVQWNGTFTSQFNTIPFQTVLANLQTNGFVQNTFSASISLTTVPEPDTTILMGVGLLMVGLVFRRWRKA